MFIYGYGDLISDLKKLRGEFGIFSVGRSFLGRELVCIKYGYGSRRIFINGAHHAGESITSAVIMRFASGFSGEFKYLGEKATIFMIPMVNPDGVELVKSGCDGFPNSDFLINANGGNDDFTYWQANARGVDLNHNYDAGWKTLKQMEIRNGITMPSPTRFGGMYPESEPETKAMADFTRCEKFDLSISYHTQGREIYYSYLGFAPENSLEIARKMSKASGYALSEPSGIASYGGYKDWFIKKIKKPGFTVEAGFGKNPLPFSQADDIYNENKGLIEAAVLG